MPAVFVKQDIAELRVSGTPQRSVYMGLCAFVPEGLMAERCECHGTNHDNGYAV